MRSINGWRESSTGQRRRPGSTGGWVARKPQAGWTGKQEQQHQAPRSQPAQPGGAPHMTRDCEKTRVRCPSTTKLRSRPITNTVLQEASKPAPGGRGGRTSGGQGSAGRQMGAWRRCRPADDRRRTEQRQQSRLGCLDGRGGARQGTHRWCAPRPAASAPGRRRPTRPTPPPPPPRAAPRRPRCARPAPWRGAAAPRAARPRCCGPRCLRQSFHGEQDSTRLHALALRPLRLPWCVSLPAALPPRPCTQEAAHPTPTPLPRCPAAPPPRQSCPQWPPRRCRCRRRRRRHPGVPPPGAARGWRQK